MWIDRKTYDDLRLQLAQKSGENVVLNQNYTALMTTLDWLRVRVTQLEMERAQLIFNYTGVKMPTPVIKNESKPDPALNPMTQTPNFNDIGDEEAAKLGIGWADDGTLTYAKQ